MATAPTSRLRGEQTYTSESEKRIANNNPEHAYPAASSRHIGGEIARSVLAAGKPQHGSDIPHESPTGIPWMDHIASKPPSKPMAGAPPSKPIAGAPPSKPIAGAPPSKPIAGAAMAGAIPLPQPIAGPIIGGPIIW